jgi:hypothetical protein
MSRRLSYFLLFFLLLQTLELRAQDVSDSQIIKTASAFVQGYIGNNDHRAAGVRNLDFGDGSIICVVELSPEGWLLMSRDYSAMPVIAFSLGGTFIDPPADLKDNRFVFLSGYAEQLKSSAMEKSTMTDPRWDPSFWYRKSGTATASATVSPLIRVTWNQGNGWNRFCPVDADGPGGHTYAGCVAVSMAQAMSVYGVPSRGKGSNQYLHPEYGSIYADFGATTYDWANMSPSIPDDKNALIIYHCAVSVDMDFAPDGSGTLTSAAASTAMKEFFYYSQRMAWTRRGTDTELWKSRLDTSLLAGRPIIYSGFPDVGSVGHAFNVDGVFKSNYYHVNWGWSGVNDGYYTIDNLKPGSSDFTKNQSAILNIQPYYYPTGVEMSDTLVLLSQPAGKAVGRFSIIDEADDNTYSVALECDSTFSGTEWVPDYYLDGDSLRAARTFERIDGPIDTVTFIVADAHNNHIRATRLLLLTASLSVTDHSAESDFTIFPVPASDYLVVNMPAGATILTITDLSGNRIAGINPDSERIIIPVSDLPSGLYIVSVSTRQGRHYSKAFVKN